MVLLCLGITGYALGNHPDTLGRVVAALLIGCAVANFTAAWKITQGIRTVEQVQRQIRRLSQNGR